jgi:serine/threonine-protein kinase RsbW
MSVIERKFLLQVPSSTENLAIVREFLNSVGRQAGMDDDEVAKVQLAVDEACSNVIEHAYGHDSSKEVMVRVSFDHETLRIEVIDTGQGFDPSSIPRQELEELAAQRKTGGLGVRLIQKLMDEVHYEVGPGKKNQIRMIKKIAR